MQIKRGAIMNYKRLFNLASDYILFATNNAGYFNFIKVNNLQDNNETRQAFKNAYRHLLKVLSY